MQYRTLGKSGLRVSAISLGTEYLLNQPRERVVEVIRAAIDQGVNYFDLFWPQPAFRDNMGAAFKGYRERVMLAAHLGAAMKGEQYEKTRDLKACRAFFEDFLTRYSTDYVDVLFLHNIDEQADYDEVMRSGGMAEMAQCLKEEGRTRLIGFSGHTVSTALQAVESGIVDVLMFPINLAGNAIPGRKELFNACATRGVGLVAMKPFAGGKLLQKERVIAIENWQRGGAPKQVEKIGHDHPRAVPGLRAGAKRRINRRSGMQEPGGVARRAGLLGIYRGGKGLFGHRGRLCRIYPRRVRLLQPLFALSCAH